MVGVPLGKAVKWILGSLVNVRELGIFIPFVILFIVVGAVNPVFFSSANLINVGRDIAFLLILSLGVTIVMLGGGIDISVATVAGLSGVMAGVAMYSFNLPVLVAILIALATGALCGFINGFSVVRLGIPSIIATLGMMFTAQGLGLIATAGTTMYGFPEAYVNLGQGRILGLHNVIWVAVSLLIIVFVLVHRSRLGYHIAAMGGNPEAARRFGLNVSKIQWSTYVLSGLFAAVMGILLTARLASARPDYTYGMEMRAIVATIIGGTSLFGGVATIPGTFAGAAIMGMLTDALIIMKVPTYWQDVFIGFLIVAAVSFDIYRRRIRFIPELADRLKQQDVAVERPNLGMVLKGAGISLDSLSKCPTNGEPVLKMVGITKYFGYVHALDRVDFEVHPNEVLALVGDNGAGKSTLVKIASGSLMPDRGEIFVLGERAVFSGPRDATSRGIAMLYQDLSLIEPRDVAANLFLGREPTRWRWFVDRKRMFEGSALIQAGLKMNIPSPKSAVQYLSGGQRQGVAIARAVSQGASLLILDEPTASLGVQESARVLSLIEELKQVGCSIVVISHNLHHVFSIADRITVLRAGRRVGTWLKKDTNPDEIVAAITGAKMLESIH